MFSFPLIYSENTNDFSLSRGANQGEWILCKASSGVKYVAAKDAGPCLLIFMSGQCIFEQAHFAAVAHISVAEYIDSLSEMCDEMNKRCSHVQISIISSMSTEDSDLTKQVLAFLGCYFPSNGIGVDLGNRTSKAVLEIETGTLWRQKDIPFENYGLFDAKLYFQKAVIGIFDKNKKRALEKVYDNTTLLAATHSKEIVVYQPNNTLLLIKYLLMMQLVANSFKKEPTQESEEYDNHFKKRLT